MRIFKTAEFHKFAKKNKIDNARLIEAVKSIESGASAVHLGGGVYKVRIARKGEGKSGGYRSFVVMRRAERAFFIAGFAKNDTENIDSRELKLLKLLAKELLEYDEEEIKRNIKTGFFQEINS